MAPKKPTQSVTKSDPGKVVEPLPTSPLAGYRVAKRVTSNLISLNHNPSLCVTVQGEIVHQDSELSAQPGGKAMALVEVSDMQSGEVGYLIVPTVLESALKRVAGGYVGKSFLIQKALPMPGKRYMNIDLYELEPTKGGRGNIVGQTGA